MFHERSNPFLQRKNPIDIYKIHSPSKIQYGRHYSPPYTSSKLSSVYRKQAQEQIICEKIMKRYERTLYEVDERGHCLASQLIIQKLIDGRDNQELELEKILKENKLVRQNRCRQSSRVAPISTQNYYLKKRQTDLKDFGVKISKTRHILNNYKQKQYQQKFSLENIYKNKRVNKDNEKKEAEQEQLMTFVNFKQFAVQQVETMNLNVPSIRFIPPKQLQISQFQYHPPKTFPPTSISISNTTYYLIS